MKTYNKMKNFLASGARNQFLAKATAAKSAISSSTKLVQSFLAILNTHFIANTLLFFKKILRIMIFHACVIPEAISVGVSSIIVLSVTSILTRNVLCFPAFLNLQKTITNLSGCWTPESHIIVILVVGMASMVLTLTYVSYAKSLSTMICNAEESVDHCVIEKSTRVEPMDSINYGIIKMKIEDDSTATEMEIEKFSNAHCHLKHISHKQPLVFNEEEQQNYSYNKENSCFGCEELVLGPSYNCSQCNFFLHKTCAELPLKIKHPFHRKHPLVLIPDTSNVSWRRPACFFCNESCRRFAYSCSNCACYLNIKCATLSCVIEPEAREHQIIHWMRAIPFTCNACGEKESEQTPYFCTACRVKVHKSCMSLPHSIKIIQHNHPLCRNHFFHENVSAGSLNCGICEKEVNSECGSYYCPDYCNFIAHVSCALEFEDKDQK
ncbi:hypothetical protein Patl1_32945 [Pistacia atlantica]|uniref:Uncharacterized protein n=1 Tax=Pistacia atlantica TaxID=434234 RepID=A0ACC1APV5_9ROSI|nr:hypothetical protein Patl1_32945 [Pistacia atlantica]